jgi:4-hydroxy-tetrahydrodipicolinate synthase
MSIGAKGLISVISNVYPKEFYEIVELAKNPETSSFAFYLFLFYNNLIRLLFTETSPSPVKTALKIKGVIMNDDVRLPLVSTSIELKNKIQGELIMLNKRNAK